jgi:5-oxoprolinase (ATP-hydrolysing) subunit C
MTMTVMQIGAGLSIQDGGRPGFQHVGVSRSGALDLHSMQLANAWLGNDLMAPVVELNLGGTVLVFDDDAEFSIAGAMLSPTLDGHALQTGTRHFARAKSILRFGAATLGAHAYLALTGGVRAEKSLGSASLDFDGDLGPPAFKIGDRICATKTVRLATSNWLDARTWTQSLSLCRSVPTIRFVPSPYWQDLPESTRHLALHQAWRIGRKYSRRGMALEGPYLDVPNTADQDSVGVLPGCLQLTPSGQIFALLAEAGVSGGYPVLGYVIRADIATLAQLRPTQTLLLQPCTVAQALQADSTRQFHFARQLIAVRTRLET